MTQDNKVKLVWEREAAKPKDPAVRVSDREWVFPFPVLGSDSLFGMAPKPCHKRDVRPVNRLIHGDNMDVLECLLAEGYAGKIDLIYIDPPYLSETRYDSRVELDNGDSTKVVRRKVFDDIWGRGINSYLNHIYPRLQLMRELLSDKGSIFVHLDWHVSHYVKLLLDEIFSPASMVNEIIWCYGGGSGARRHFHRKHDVILWYAKGADYIFNPQYRPYTRGTLERGLTRVKGDKYRLREEGAIMSDWWPDISKILSPTAHENLKFPTQKPIALLRRIILTASHPGSLVADFYSGSGTLAEASDENGRFWISCDNSPIAIHTAMHRLIKKTSPAFAVQEVHKEKSVADLIEPIQAEVQKLESANRVYLNIEAALNNGSAQDLLFWALDVAHRQNTFISDIQVTREKTRGVLPLEITLNLPAGPVEIGIKAYDWWGREYYNKFRG